MSGNTTDETKKKRGISELAHISTLTEEELREAEEEAEAAGNGADAADDGTEERQSVADYMPEAVA